MCYTITRRDLLMSALTICVTCAVLNSSSFLINSTAKFTPTKQLRAQGQQIVSHINNIKALSKTMTGRTDGGGPDSSEEDDGLDILPEILELIKRKKSEKQSAKKAATGGGPVEQVASPPVNGSTELPLSPGEGSVEGNNVTVEPLAGTESDPENAKDEREGKDQGAGRAAKKEQPAESVPTLAKSNEIFPPAKMALDNFTAFCKTNECMCHSDIKKDQPTFFGVRPSAICPGEIKTVPHSLTKGRYAYVSLYVGKSVGGRNSDACAKVLMCDSEQKHEERTLITMLKVLRHSLLQQGVSYPYVVIYPAGTHDEELKPLKDAGFNLIKVDPVNAPSHVSGTDEKKFHSQSYTKLATFNLVQYEKVVYLDADMIVGENLDFLFEAETPAFIVQNKFEFQHSKKSIPSRLSAPMHAGMMVVSPDAKKYQKMLAKIAHVDSYDGGDTGFMWSYLPMYYEIPASVVRIKYDQENKVLGNHYHVLHYVGNKPLTCGRGLDCNRDVNSNKMTAPMRHFYAADWHNLWWHWHDHMLVLTEDKCNAEVALSISERLNQANFCFDGRGNVGTLLEIQCDDQSNYIIVNSPNQQFLTGECSKGKADGPSKQGLCHYLEGAFAAGDGSPFAIDCAKEKHVVPPKNLAGFIEKNMLKNPDSSKDSPLPIMFWWETEKGKTISPATSRIMHTAIKSAALHCKQGTEILVFSNSLPVDFFCKKSTLRGWERTRALPFTCRARVKRYNVKKLMSTLPEAHAGIDTILRKIKGATGDSKGYMHTMSDVVRFLLLYRYGGTYMDFDQIFIRPLPAELKPLISRENEWRAEDCNKNTQVASTAYCNEIGPANAVPGRFGNPPLESDDGGMVFSMYSGLLASFPVAHPYILKMIEMIPTEYRDFCWGCLGPNLVTKAFSQIAKATNVPPAHTLSSNNLLMIKHQWRQVNFTKEEFEKNKGPIVDVDFHTTKKPNSMLSELVSRTLYAFPKENYNSLLDLIDDQGAYEKAKMSLQVNRSDIQTSEFAKLPWLNN
jgi:hypothetical protein